ncbi:hypothetical protein NIES4071_05230 [Calothrix sp. NIES-4071]|nr:hypothetical protein NIES4071_05230 [Calothrix sp. NIES-4071]BAZ54869.1 hypothetical protein NIES4105_05220 [Calothrix sp. NIES-4105]
MTYKIRRFKSKTQVHKRIKTDKNLQLEKKIQDLELKLEKLNSEFLWKSYELEKIKSLKDIEKEINSIIISILVNNTDNKLYHNVVLIDTLINHLTTKLLDVYYLFNSAIQWQSNK